MIQRVLQGEHWLASVGWKHAPTPRTRQLMNEEIKR